MTPEKPAPSSNEQKPTFLPNVRLYNSEKNYFYEEGTIFGEEKEEGLKIWGEGEEFERVKRYLFKHEIPSRYRKIFDFDRVYPDNKGGPALSDGGKWRGYGIERIKDYFRRQARNFEEVPITTKYTLALNPEYVSYRKIYDLLEPRAELLREAGIDYLPLPAETPAVWKRGPDGFEVLPINMAIREFERLAEELDEKKRREDEEWK